MKEQEFVFEWGERASLWLHDFFSYPFIQQDNLPWNKVNNSIMFVINPDISGGYIEKTEFEERARKHAEFFLDKKRQGWLLEKYKELLQELDLYLESVEDINFSQMSREEILPYFKHFVSICNETCRWYRGTRQEAEIEVAKVIKDVIGRYYPKNKEEEIFHTLTTSPYSDPISEERDDWIRLLQKKACNNDDFKKHIRKHSMFFTNIYTEKKLKETISKRYDQDKKRMREILKEKTENERKRKLLLKKQENILEKIEEENIAAYLTIFHRFGEYRFRLKPGYAGIEVLSLPMLSRIGELAKMTVQDLHEYVTIKETLHFLKTGELSHRRIISDREKCRVYIVRNKQQVILQGDEGINFLNRTIFTKKREMKELKGMSACPGYVKGKVRLILSNSMDNIQKAMDEFTEGDILVTHNTQPNMVQLMVKASAIVTAQGGITSHSAIVARELQIPCVVGIDSVTLHLKDKDIIEVDATRGIVRKCQK